MVSFTSRSTSGFRYSSWSIDVCWASQWLGHLIEVFKSHVEVIDVEVLWGCFQTFFVCFGHLSMSKNTFWSTKVINVVWLGHIRFYQNHSQYSSKTLDLKSLESWLFCKLVGYYKQSSSLVMFFFCVMVAIKSQCFESLGFHWTPIPYPGFWKLQKPAAYGTPKKKLRICENQTFLWGANEKPWVSWCVAPKSQWIPNRMTCFPQMILTCRASYFQCRGEKMRHLMKRWWPPKSGASVVPLWHG